MVIDDAFEIAAPLEAVWSVLKDIPRVASAIPHARIVNVVDDRTYNAVISVKLGPVSVGYDASIVVEAIDDAARTATLRLKGVEAKGRGGVNATITAHAQAQGAQTRVSLHTEATISGLVASIGSRMIEGVAKKTVATFAQNLRALLSSA